ncbi:deoxyribodipyrimidine photo-lyase [Dyadobacter arcticus]|uniref:Deoxyribodipyrimidine photo-lyase n=1 Tax=Dyadobacter arcticus TaxID=1078754 RepID=A0ABX0UGU8_9BACT|nr:deoxyribodipyrimidine photo-lyase [Dyadobacter arcticus]NIJ51299.1 deoxyribodipyrimidine photo-lyase [Dyadobacter arcticus]
MTQRIIYWFRNDLRLNDNEALFKAVQAAPEIIPVYVFDPRQFEKTRLGFRRTSALRAQFIIDCVSDLRNRLRERGGDLLIRIGEPERIVPKMAEDYGAEYVYTSKEIGPEETIIESSLSKNLKTGNVDIKLFWMDTLVHAVDLPFAIAKLPSNFPDFYKSIKNNLIIKNALSEPESFTLPQELEAGTLPTLPILGIDPKEILAFRLKRIPYFSGETQAISAFDNFLETNNTTGKDEKIADALTDSRLSEWLSLGCLSARSIYNHIQAQSGTARTDILIQDLLKRDYFHWILLRYGPRIFKPSGIKHDFSTQWTSDIAILNSWINGETTHEEINAIMLKLRTDGFLTSEERRISADYLVNSLGVNWTLGAMYFESCLLDYEVSVNWGKWNNIAGVGEY